MAKVAYCRQQLWKRYQPHLAEKLRRRQRQGLLRGPGSAGGYAPTFSSINFADPDAVSRSAAAFSTRKRLMKNSEVTETMNGHDMSSDSDFMEAKLQESSQDDMSISVGSDIGTVNQPSGIFIGDNRSEPLLPELVLPDGMDPDDDWRAMTEEEESLVQEEQSLKKEIEEEESICIDDELERQVAAEAAALEQQEVDEAEKVAKEKELFATVSWGDIVEQELASYRKQREFAEKQERLLSSPSKKR
ncbi:unnamed protein product [Gongylonema pulchrum]|uniref:SAFB-like transcription modulator n=1 Tax=Gongylonema pulchrum TaxID=637853 RepID=A0A183EKP4_9BILA|nr:unnamed protein product [Gongylonema pulchrum]